MPKEKSILIKSRQRVRNQGEVFTQDREVKNILALTQATDNIYWRFLEPACGNGNFLVEIVRQRMEKIKSDPNYRPEDKREYAVINSVSTIYGIDIASDNIAECKKRILAVISDYIPKKPSKAFFAAAQAILDTNIILGDSLNGKEKIFFVEYKLTPPEYLSKTKMKRKIYNLLKLENGTVEPIDSLPLTAPADLTAVPYDKYLDTKVTDQLRQINLFGTKVEAA